MSKVDFQYSPKRGGKTVSMARRYAETLQKLGHGTYTASEPAYQTRMLTAGKPLVKAEDDGPLVSKEVAEFAKDNDVDLDKVVGTGKDGRIKKSDIEAFLDARDLT